MYLQRPAGCLVCFIIGCVILYSCKKLDIPGSTWQETDQTARFFTIPTRTDPKVKKLAAWLSETNARHPFVTAFAKKNGFPAWDKAIVRAFPSRAGAALTGEDTILIIPLVLQDSLTVNGFILAKANDTTGIHYRLASDYKAYPAVVNGNEFTATKFAGLCMLLDNRVFGYTDFTITDSSLFRSNGTVQPQGPFRVQLQPEGEITGNNVLLSYTICYRVQTGHCTCNNPGDCDMCLRDCAWELCLDFEVDIFDGPAGGSGPGEGGSGGGGIPHEYPCDPGLPGPVGAVPGDPCLPPGGGPGWEPDSVPAFPCDPYMLSLEADVYFSNIFKYLGQPSVLSMNVETGFPVNRTVMPYVQKTGTDINDPVINWYFPGGTKYDGLLHSHFCANAQHCISPMFSPQDLILMAQMYLGGFAKDPANLFMGIATTNGPYMIKVSNTASFRAFAEKLLGSKKNMDDFNEDYSQKLNSASSDENEKQFLLMMREKGIAEGLTLYNGNQLCNKWTKLKLSEFNGAIEDPCY